MNPNTQRDPGAAFRQAVIEAGSRQYEVTYAPDGSIRVVNNAPGPARPGEHNGPGGLNGRSESAAPFAAGDSADDSADDSTVTYTLGEVAELTGLYPQYLLNLVERHKLVQPARSAEAGLRAVYHFSPAQVEKVRRFIALTDKGVKAGKAVQMVAEEEQRRSSARRAMQAIGSWLDNPWRAGDWPGVVAALAAAPGFSEQERALLQRLEGEGNTLHESMAALGIRTEKEARDMLHSAYRKVGEHLFDALRAEAAA